MPEDMFIVLGTYTKELEEENEMLRQMLEDERKAAEEYIASLEEEVNLWRDQAKDYELLYEAKEASLKEKLIYAFRGAEIVTLIILLLSMANK